MNEQGTQTAETTQLQGGASGEQSTADTTTTATAGGQAGGASGGITFTTEQQTHINSLLANEKRDAERRVKESDELKQLRQKAKAFDDAEEANKTEAQKLTDERDQFKTRAEQLEREIQQERRNRAVSAQAAAKGVPGDRTEDALRLIDMDAIEFDSHGQPKKGDVEKAVDALIQSRPWLVGRAVPDQNANGAAGSTLTQEQALAQETQRLKATGRYT